MGVLSSAETVLILLLITIRPIFLKPLHSLHANTCVGGEYNYIRLVNKDPQAAVRSRIPPRRNWEGGCYNTDLLSEFDMCCS